MPSFASARLDRGLRCALLLFGALAAGCALFAYSTPERALESALHSAHRQRLEPLKASLTGDALQAYSSPEALAELGVALRQIESIAPIRPAADNVEGEFETTAVARSAAGAPVVYRFRIRCETSHYVNDTPFQKGTCWQDPSGQGLPDICDPDTQATHYEIDLQDCRLTEIKRG